MTYSSNSLKAMEQNRLCFFELLNGNKHIYTIYFASGSPKGCDLMKQAIWKADPSGGYRLRAYARNQKLLFEADTDPLAEQLRSHFGDELTPVEEIEAFVMSDATIFHTGQLRKATLQRLEQEKRIIVSRPDGGRGFRNHKGIKVRFR